MRSVVAKKLNNEPKEFVTQIIGEVINDPDSGLNLSEEVKKHLREAEICRGKNISSAS